MFNSHILITIWPVENKCVTKMLTKKAKVDPKSVRVYSCDPPWLFLIFFNPSKKITLQ